MTTCYILYVAKPIMVNQKQTKSNDRAAILTGRQIIYFYIPICVVLRWRGNVFQRKIREYA